MRHRRAAPRDPTRVTRRLFLVAGSAGSGKSTLAKALAHELDAGWLQLDSIWLAMKVAAGEGTPAQDVLDIDRRMRREDEADDDVLAAHVAASGEVCRALPTVLGLELAGSRAAGGGRGVAAAVVRDGARAARHGGACGVRRPAHRG